MSIIPPGSYIYVGILLWYEKADLRACCPCPHSTYTIVLIDPSLVLTNSTILSFFFLVKEKQVGFLLQYVMGYNKPKRTKQLIAEYCIM